MFVPDVAGIYVLQLIVIGDDDMPSAPARVTVTASEIDPGPVAIAGRDRTVAVGIPVQVDGERSFDPSGRSLAFSWLLDGRPAGSAVDSSQIAFRDTAIARFTPDVTGTYVIRLRVGSGDAVAEDRVTVLAVHGNLPPVADAGIDRRADRRVAVRLDGEASTNPDAGPAPLRFAWRLIARPAGSELTTAGIRDAGCRNSVVHAGRRRKATSSGSKSATAKSTMATTC